jgi:hypothetical protein
MCKKYKWNDTVLFEAYVTWTTNKSGVLHSGITFKEGRGIVKDTETARLKTHRSDENTEICQIAFAQTGPNIIDTGSEAIT